LPGVRLYRPTYDSIMRSGLWDDSFDQVNSEVLVRRFYTWVKPIDSAVPAEAALAITTEGQADFALTVPQPLGAPLSVGWSVDGAPVGGGPTLTLGGADLQPGPHLVRATVHDPTDFVRKDPTGLLTASRTWTLEVLSSGEPGTAEGGAEAPAPAPPAAPAPAAGVTALTGSVGGPRSVRLRKAFRLVLSFSRPLPRTRVTLEGRRAGRWTALGSRVVRGRRIGWRVALPKRGRWTIRARWRTAGVVHHTRAIRILVR
jgi:hypothetical protein